MDWLLPLSPPVVMPLLGGYALIFSDSYFTGQLNGRYALTFVYIDNKILSCCSLLLHGSIQEAYQGL